MRQTTSRRSFLARTLSGAAVACVAMATSRNAFAQKVLPAEIHPGSQYTGLRKPEPASEKLGAKEAPFPGPSKPAEPLAAEATKENAHPIRSSIISLVILLSPVALLIGSILQNTIFQPSRTSKRSDFHEEDLVGSIQEPPTSISTVSAAAGCEIHPRGI